eukprot:NODE_2748_length_1129_cov_28.046296_g2523_i0.p1 GENE.NODE_2748_length_1129_cov_28.046296_g2523_i0~~NODE_2748_length_1129_cov_28.046296_g2523_i0.p1  ORF type:complete len:209 (-),score=3.03 NODE_2748_length_1129_cov_28.046296_g2523_i0:101-727(-)
MSILAVESQRDAPPTLNLSQIGIDDSRIGPYCNNSRLEGTRISLSHDHGFAVGLASSGTTGGVGVDICLIDRIEGLMQKFPRRSLHRRLVPSSTLPAVGHRARLWTRSTQLALGWASREAIIKAAAARLVTSSIHLTGMASSTGLMRRKVWKLGASPVVRPVHPNGPRCVGICRFQHTQASGFLIFWRTKRPRALIVVALEASRGSLC